MWDTLSKILNIMLGVSTAYLYFENRKLRRLEIDRDIEIKRIEITELNNEYLKEKEKLNVNMASRGLTFSSFKTKGENILKVKYTNKIEKNKADLTYLEKLRKYKWIFSK